MSFRMHQIYSWLKRHFNEEIAGQGLVEYALIVFLVAVIVIAILVLLGPQIGSVFSVTNKGFPTRSP